MNLFYMMEHWLLSYFWCGELFIKKAVSKYLSIWPAFTLPPLPQRRKKNLQTMPLLLSWASKALDIVTIKVIWRCVWFMFINSVFANWFPCIIYQQHCGLKFRALIEQILGFSKWLKEFLNLKSSYTIKRSSTVNYLNLEGYYHLER